MTTSLQAAKKAAHNSVVAAIARDQAIRKAHADGATIRAIAAVVDLSSARVHQILHGKAAAIAHKRKPPPPRRRSL